MNDAERLRVLVRALLPFALAAKDSALAQYTNHDNPLYIYAPSNGALCYYEVEFDAGRVLIIADLHAAADALRAAGYADALTDDSARDALEGDE